MPGRVAPGTVRLAIAPVRALLATAFEDGLIRSNPAAGVRISQPVEQDADADQTKALTEDELATLIAAVPDEWKLIDFTAQTGLRISEVLALRWTEIDFGRRRVLVRRRLRNGSFGPPKSKYGRRDVPISSVMGQDYGRPGRIAGWPTMRRCSRRAPAPTSTRPTCSAG